MLTGTYVNSNISLKLNCMAESIQDFVSQHYLKGLASIAVYFLWSLVGDIRTIKDNLAQVLTNQAVLEQRMSNLEAKSSTYEAKFTKIEEDKINFFQTYKLEKK